MRSLIKWQQFTLIHEFMKFRLKKNFDFLPVSNFGTFLVDSLLIFRSVSSIPRCKSSDDIWTRLHAAGGGAVDFELVGIAGKRHGVSVVNTGGLGVDNEASAQAETKPVSRRRYNSSENSILAAQSTPGRLATVGKEKAVYSIFNQQNHASIQVISGHP